MVIFLPPASPAERHIASLKAGNPIVIRKFINGHFISICFCVNIVHYLFFPHFCLFPWHLSVNDHILSQHLFCWPKWSRLLFPLLKSRLSALGPAADLERDQSHTRQLSRSSRMPTDRNTSPALLEIPSRHHIMAQNPLGLQSMARLLFHLYGPNLRASAYHRNCHCLSLRAYTQSYYPFLLFQSQIPCIQHSKFLYWWCF